MKGSSKPRGRVQRPPTLVAAMKDTGARSLTSAIYSSLRSDILACRLSPGEKLLIAPLAERFSSSIGAVREALSRLVADGLVTSHDQRGFRVDRLDLGDLEDLAATRVEIETLALRRAIWRGDENWEREIRRSLEVLEGAPRIMDAETTEENDQWSQCHAAFHEALVSAAGLSWLLKFRRVLFMQADRYRALARTAYGNRRDVRNEHRALMQAALDRDEAKAEVLTRIHMERTMSFVRDALRRTGM